MLYEVITSKRVTTGYRYRIGLQLGLCLGHGLNTEGAPSLKLKRWWAGKYTVWQGSLVITSYSIHYTKLYDRRRMALSTPDFVHDTPVAGSAS